MIADINRFMRLELVCLLGLPMFIASSLTANAQRGHTVGHVRIEVPRGARGYSIAKTDEFTSPTPLIGLGPGGAPSPSTQRYAFQLSLGASPAGGCYRSTFSLNNGNSWALFVGVPTAAACAQGD